MASYGSAAGQPSYGYGNYGGATSASGAAAPDHQGGLKRRTGPIATSNPNGNGSNGNNGNNANVNGKDGHGDGRPSKQMVQHLDFMFPKVDKEFTVQTQGGGVATVVAYTLIALLALAEGISYMGQNRSELEHIRVDTSLGKRMRVNMNITFPSLACDDLHLDAIDVAGDSQLDVEDTLKKRKLHIDGSPMTKDELDVDLNLHRTQQEDKDRLIKEGLAEDYCGPCYGAQVTPGECCQTCDQVISAYQKKKWNGDLLKFTAEQCIREGRDKEEPKRMIQGQGCSLVGFMTVNRVSGNFHIAMGEGVERDGRHIHTFMPEDAPNFNASHVIHHMSFGGGEAGKEPLNGVTKMVTDDTGVTGLFQYFIKIVPTTYIGKEAFPEDIKAAGRPNMQEGQDPNVFETNRYFFTERFRPLMTELLDEAQMDKENDKKAHALAGGVGGHHDKDHHNKIQNSVLPGIFFIYEIYPFAVEISRNSVPFTHLVIRLMATIGGVFTLVKWADSYLYERLSGRSSRR
jgi:hypothetical protein